MLLWSVWMDVVGDGPAETQGAVRRVSLVAIPGGLWAGWSLFGRRAGSSAPPSARSTRSTGYAQETRMYSAHARHVAAARRFLHVFAFGRRRYLPVFMILLAGMLDTHNWGLFWARGSRWADPCWYAPRTREPLKDALIGFGAVGLLYLPWLPTLLHQAQHTGAPWLNPPNFGAPCRSESSSAAARRPSRSCSRAGRGWR